MDESWMKREIKPLIEYLIDAGMKDYEVCIGNCLRYPGVYIYFQKGGFRYKYVIHYDEIKDSCLGSGDYDSAFITEFQRAEKLFIQAYEEHLRKLMEKNEGE